MLSKPTLQTFVARDIDFESLTFLFEKAGRRKLFEDLHLCQELTADMRGCNLRRNEILSDVHKEADKHTSVVDAERAVGENLIKAANHVVSEVGIRAVSSLDIRLSNTFESLRAALSEDLEPLLRRILRQKISWVSRRLAPPPLIELKELDEDLRPERLPEISYTIRRKLGIRQQGSVRICETDDLEEE